MSVCLTSGLLTLSVDADGPAGSAPSSLVLALADELGRHGLQATWVVAEPAAWRDAAGVLARDPGHELALTAAAEWSDTDMARGAFARQLAVRLERATTSGARITTLVATLERLHARFDLAARCGITALRHPADHAGGGQPAQPRLLSHGLWSFPTAIRLPGSSRWLPGGGGTSAARHAIDAAACQGGLVQLVVDLPRLAARGGARRALAGVLRHVAQRRAQGGLTVTTLAGAVAQLAAHNRREPSRSILRPAA